MKRTAAFLGFLFFLAMILCGCRFVRIEEEEREAVEYTIVKQEDIPKEAAVLIDGKKTREFQMTYQVGDELYLVKGYGQQMTGGYSIQVEEVSCSSNTLFVKTKLLGPSDRSQGSEPSCPYIVIKTKYRDMPVEFIRGCSGESVRKRK